MENQNDFVKELSSLVYLSQNQPKTTSLLIADYFGKQHKDVLQKIKTLSTSKEFIERNFTLNEYTDPIGRKLPMYEVTKDGFVFLVMGFTGDKAAQLKEAYINAFNRLEEQVKSQKNGGGLVEYWNTLSPVDQALQFFTALKQKEELQINFTKALPKIEFAERVEQASNSLSVEEFAKSLGVGRNRMFEWLREKGYLLSRGESYNLPRQEYIDSGYFIVKESVYEVAKTNEKRISFQPRITGKGQVYLANKFKKTVQTNELETVVL